MTPATQVPPPMVQLAVRRPPPSSLPAWTKHEFEAALRAKERYYHIHHPFQVRMNAGQLTPDAVRGWVANRFYYQTSIPLKDAAIMANCRSRAARRLWVQRIVDHDGTGDGDGGIEAWLQLGEAVGLRRTELEDERHVLPGVRFAVDAYVNFARAASFEEAACSSLTEMFAPTIHQKRLDNWPEVYPWIEPQGYRYFRERLAQARRDVEHGLAVTLEHFQGRVQQEYALNILQFKLDVLWSMLDAMWLAYVADMPPFHGCAD